MTNVDMRAGGKGRKDRNAAIAAELFATLDATHGNAAQARSLNAIIERATVRYIEATARKQARIERTHDAADEELAQAEEQAQAQPVKQRKARKVVTATPINVKPEEWAAVREDADREDAFIARMRALAAQNEAEGIATA